MPDFKFAKGFFTGVLVADVIITTGLLFIAWHTLYTLKPREDHIHHLGRYGRYDSYAEYRKHERDKEFL